MTDDQKQKMKEYIKEYHETKKKQIIKINKMFNLIINNYNHFDEVTK